MKIALKWEWAQPGGHDQQTRLSWWVEQVCIRVLCLVAGRAHRRGDQQTVNRILAVSRAGARAEKAARS